MKHGLSLTSGLLLLLSGCADAEDGGGATEPSTPPSETEPSETEPSVTPPTAGGGATGSGEPSSGPNSAGGAGGQPTSNNGGVAGAATDQQGFFGESRCTPDFLLCEGFEAGAFDESLWEPSGATPTIEPGDAARGSFAARFHTEENGFSFLRQSATFPVPENRFYARAFVRFSALPTAPMWAHWTFSGAVGSGDPSEIRVGGQYDGNNNRFGVGTDLGPTGDWTNLDRDPGGNARAVPEGEWVCLEWMNDGSTDESRFFWDEVEHPSLFSSRTEHGGNDVDYVLPEFESMWFGWWLYQGDPSPAAYDIWMDELVVDDEPIGCTR